MVPRIYFADLEAYNSGRLQGDWVEFFDGIEADDVRLAVDAMLKKSAGEEWRIDDREHFAEFDGNNFEELCQVAALIHEHGEGAVKGFISHVGSSYVGENLDSFDDIYMGCFKSEVDFCEERIGDEGGLKAAAEEIQVFDWGTLAQYIDWECIANDVFISLYFSQYEGYQKVHVYLR